MNALKLAWGCGMILLVIVMGIAWHASYGAFGTATLGTDERDTHSDDDPNWRFHSGTLRLQAGTDFDPCADNYGFAFMRGVTKGTPQVDVCVTTKNGGTPLTVTEAVASPEYFEPVMASIDGEAVTFTGRTGDCFYMVTGVPGSGIGKAPPGADPVKWHSDFDTNNDGVSPHFVVYVNDRYCASDDYFLMDSTSAVRIELHNYGAIAGTVKFTLNQTSSAGGGAVTFIDPVTGHEVVSTDEPTHTYDLEPGVTATVQVKGRTPGIVTIQASQAIVH